MNAYGRHIAKRVVPRVAWVRGLSMVVFGIGVWLLARFAVGVRDMGPSFVGRRGQPTSTFRPSLWRAWWPDQPPGPSRQC